MKAITKNVPRDASYVSPVYILNGGALLRKLKWIPNFTVHVILQYSQYIKFKYGLCCVVFDEYDEKPSIKDHEHQRRSRNASSCTIKFHVVKNKAKFIELLSKHLANDGLIFETVKAMLTL